MKRRQRKRSKQVAPVPSEWVPLPGPREPESIGRIVALLGGNQRAGPWSPRGRLQVMSIMGGVELDFREADLLEGTTVVDTFAVMGGIEIKVPTDVNVHCEGFGLLGGFSTKAHRATDPSAPTIVVRGLAILGGVEVKVQPPSLPAGAGGRTAD